MAASYSCFFFCRIFFCFYVFYLVVFKELKIYLRFIQGLFKQEFPIYVMWWTVDTTDAPLTQFTFHSTYDFYII